MARSATTTNGSNSRPDHDDLSAQIETLKEDIGNITETLSAMVKAQGEDVTESAKERLAEVRDRGADRAAQAQRRAAAMGDRAGDFVQDQPAIALGAAAGLGFLVGMLTSSRR